MLRHQKQITVVSIAVLLATLCAPVFAQYDLDSPSIDYFNFPFPGTDVNSLNELAVNLELSALPSTPTTNQEVTVSAQALGFDTNNALFEWFVDGQRFSPPTKGLDSVVFTASSVAGTKHLVRADVRLPDGSTRSASLIISVVEVVIGVEFQTLIPPRYKAAAVGGNDAKVRLWALPFGLGQARDIEYRWYINNKKIAGGLDLKDALTTVAGGLFTRVNVRLQLINDQAGINFDKVFSFLLSAPELVLYDGTPSRTPDPNRRFGFTKGLLIPPSSITVWPYFFNVNTLSQLRPNWLVNGAPNPYVSSFSAQPFFDFSPNTSTFNVTVTNPSSYSERASLQAGILLNR